MLNHQIQKLFMKLFQNKQYRKIFLIIFSVAIKASGIMFQLYNGGIFSRTCTAKNVDDLDHGVLAVGYAKDSYTIKNSWGASWGEKGYMRLALIAAKEG